MSFDACLMFPKTTKDTLDVLTFKAMRGLRCFHSVILRRRGLVVLEGLAVLLDLPEAPKEALFHFFWIKCNAKTPCVIMGHQGEAADLEEQDL